MAGRDHNNVKRQMPAYRSEDLSREFARNIANIIEFKRAGVHLPLELSAWAQKLAPDIKRRLAALDLLDAHIRFLDEHLADYEISLRARENSREYVGQTIKRLNKMIQGCQFRYWSDIKGSKLEQFIAGLKVGKNRPASALTKNYYLNVMKGFCRWAVRDGRFPSSPIEYLRPIDGRKVRNDQRRKRRPLSANEVRQLLNKTTAGPMRYGMTGRERAMLYRMAVETGLRSSELRSLTKASCELDGLEPVVRVSGSFTKNKEPAAILLRAETASDLKVYLANQTHESHVFRMPKKYNVIVMMRSDLKEADIHHQTRDGHVDFQSLRHTCGSLLAAAGVYPKIIQRIMRHSTIALTMDRYAHTYRGDEAAAIAKLPNLSLPQETISSTGIQRNLNHPNY